MKKSIVILLIATILMSSVGGISVQGKNLTDISNHWAENQINELVGRGIVNGYPDGTFRPNESITIGEFIKLVVTALGFTDIKSATGTYHWASSFRDKAEELRLIWEGEYNIPFYLNSPIKRREMTHIIVKAFEYFSENEIDISENHQEVILDYEFLYWGDVESILKSYKVGLITGYPDGNFKPENNATRAEATTVIMRLLEESYRVKVPYELVEPEVDYIRLNSFDGTNNIKYTLLETSVYKPELFESMKVLKEAYKETGGYGTFSFAYAPKAQISSFYKDKETYDAQMPISINRDMSIRIYSTELNDVGIKIMHHYQITMWNTEVVLEKHTSVIEEFLRHLFEADAEIVINKFYEYAKSNVFAFRDTFTYNNRNITFRGGGSRLQLDITLKK